MDKKLHTGGIVGLKPTEVPAILHTGQVISREMCDRMRVPVHMLESTGKTSMAEVEARMVTVNIQMKNRIGPMLHYIENEMPLGRRPRTGDTEQMLADINRVELTPYGRHKGLNGLVDIVVQNVLARQRGLFSGRKG